MSSRSVASLGVFIALVAAVGFGLSGVPNIELMSLITFASGALLGPLRGAFVGGAAMAIYSGFNPYGMAPPPTFAMQVLGAAFIGAGGGVAAPGGRLVRLPAAGRAAAGVLLGVGLTLLYDLLTNLGTAWAMGAWRDPWPFVAGGISFGIWHVVWNGVFFGVGLPPLLGVVERRRARGW